jgi:hypothetical protein
VNLQRSNERIADTEQNGKIGGTTNSKIPSIFDHVICNSSTIESYYHLFLEQRGHTFTSSHEGCLTPWFAEIQAEAQAERTKGFANPLVKLLYQNMQHDFCRLSDLKVVTQPC